MSGKTWKIVDIVAGLVGGACGLVGIISSLKSAEYDQQQNYADLEERYGLVPNENKETN